MILSPRASRNLNAFGLLVVSGVLAGALADQLINYDLPCPLCLLQRVGLVAVGFGLCLNLYYGPKSHHYGIMLIGAVFGGMVSIRQILLHIVPGTGSYGDPFFGLHLYTWAGLAFFFVIIGTGLMLLFEGQYANRNIPNKEPFGGLILPRVAFWIMVSLAAANAVSAFLECGPGICDDPPTDYKELDRLEGDA